MSDEDRAYLRCAARLALRGHGGAEPNPTVGCVIVKDHAVVGWGYHRRCGQAHAEVEALRRAGSLVRGATMYVTLEPCNHHGRTPPCTDAILAAGLRRVVFAQGDPHEAASGGAQRLKRAGIEVAQVREPSALVVSAPFVHHVQTGRPWVTIKWAQTLDGRIATRTGESKWISSDRSRRLVHRERGRVDAIMTGAGTVVGDDPLLTARGVRLRRSAQRVVIDPDLRVPPKSRVVTSAREVPTMVVCREALADGSAAAGFRDQGVQILGIPSAQDGVVQLAPVFEHLGRSGVTRILVEAGPGLVGPLFDQKLVNEVWVFLAPMLLGDAQATHAVAGLDVPHLADATRLFMLDSRRRGPDVFIRGLLTDPVLIPVLER